MAVKYAINTTGNDLTNDYSTVSGSWELEGVGPSGDREYVETWTCETAMPNAFERLLDTDRAVINYYPVGSDDA